MLHAVCLVSLVGLIAAISIQSGIGAENITVNLKDEAAIQSDTVYLKDVADLRGPDAAQLSSMANLSLGAVPEFGSARILSRHQIGQLMQAAFNPPPGIAFVGAPAVQIRMQGRTIDPGEVVPLIKAHLLQSTPWKESEIQIRSIGNLNGIEVPRGAELRLSSNDAPGGHRNLLVPIEIVRAGKILRCLWITAAIRIHASILTAAARIPAGKTVAAGDVVEKSVEITDLQASYVRNLDDVLQKVSRRHFSPGDPLTREAFTGPYLVKSGDTVQLRLVRNGIALTSLVRAEQNGSFGQVIKVRNLDFSTLLKAEVTGRAEVRLLQ